MADSWRDREELPDAEFLSTWQVNNHSLATGRCPRCEAWVSQQLTFSGVVITAAATNATTSIDVPVLFRCNCDENHPGLPDGQANGCGAWWVARVVTDDGTTFHILPETNASIRRETKKVADASAQSGTAAITAAEKWIPGIAALLGLSGLTTVVISRDTGSTLDFTLRAVLFGLVCVSVVSAGLATIAAYRAAYGWPKNVRLTTTDDVLATAKLLDERAAAVADRLWDAVVLAVVSTATLLAALGVLWLAPAGKA